MSSNPNEYINNVIARLLQQQQQQQQQTLGGQLNGQGSLQIPGQNFQPNSMQVPAPDQASLNALVANYLQQATAPSSSHAAAGFQPNASSPSFAAQVPQIGAPPLSQQILDSVQKLAAINPDLAVAAARQALINARSGSPAQQQQTIPPAQVQVASSQVQQPQALSSPNLAASNQGVHAPSGSGGNDVASTGAANNASAQDWTLEQLG